MDLTAAKTTALARHRNARSKSRSWRKQYEINRNYQYHSNGVAVGIWRAGFRSPGPAGETQAAGTTGQASAETPGKAGSAAEAGTPAKTATAATSSATAKAATGTEATAAKATSQEPAGSAAESGELQQAAATACPATSQEPARSAAETKAAGSGELQQAAATAAATKATGQEPAGSKAETTTATSQLQQTAATTARQFPETRAADNQETAGAAAFRPTTPRAASPHAIPAGTAPPGRRTAGSLAAASRQQLAVGAP